MTTITIHDTPSPSDTLISLLESHIPYSLPVLRRLQSARAFPGASTPNTHILHAHASLSPSVNPQQTPHFATAYLDLSRSPETECWLYSTMEDSSTSIDPTQLHLSLPEDEASLCDDLTLAIFRRARKLEAEMRAQGIPRRVEAGKMLLGSLNEVVRTRLKARGLRMAKTAIVAAELEWEFCGKWLFRVPELATEGERGGWTLGDGMKWDVVRREDVRLVQSRTLIPRQEATLLMLPSTVIRSKDDGTAIAWAFLGLDGTLMTLHVEEPYRGNGMAKLLACRLMRDHVKDYGGDGWGAADVFVSNSKSQAVCKSIGGNPSWTVSWAIVDLESSGDFM